MRPTMTARPARRLRPLQWPILAAVVAAMGMTGPVWGQTTTLSGNVGSTGGGTRQQGYNDQPFASLIGLQSVDSAGNDAVAGGSLAAPAGMFMLSAHACSGGGVNFQGSANANATCSVTLDYRVVSATLPAGTLVPVKISWALSGSSVAAGGLTHHLSGASAVVSGRVFISITGVGGGTLVNIAGERTRQYNLTNGYLNTTTGALNMEDGHADYTVNIPVGQQVRVGISGTTTGSSIAVLLSVTDGDSQLAMNWGLTSLDPAASVVSINYGGPAPPADGATPANAVAARPPRPTGGYQCFTIPTQPVAVSACAASEAAFSVSAAGTGPFTYRWRKGGTPLDTAANPSAATAMLSLASVAPADAGSYDCVITNPCGSLTSSAATLAVVSPLMITMQPVPATACPPDAAAFSIAVAPDAGYTIYQWQIQAVPGVWQTLSDDGPGALPCGGSASIAIGNEPTVQVSVTPCPGVTQYLIRCILTSACGSLTSDEVTLTVGSCCPADFNNDGNLDPDDLSDFITCFFTQAQDPTACPAADFNADGSIDPDDLSDFITAFFTGCA